MHNEANYQNNHEAKVLKPGQQARQGDVLLVPRKDITGNISADNVAERHITVYGEVTGHKHQFQPDKVESRNIITTKAGNAALIQLKDGAVMRHEEHQAIAVPPDAFIVDIQQEYDYETELFQQVAD
jgi:hypothetical protein